MGKVGAQMQRHQRFVTVLQRGNLLQQLVVLLLEQVPRLIPFLIPPAHTEKQTNKHPKVKERKNERKKERTKERRKERKKERKKERQQEGRKEVNLQSVLRGKLGQSCGVEQSNFYLSCTETEIC